MKHKMSKLLSALLCCVMLLTLLPVTAAAVDAGPDWTTGYSKSKTATNLDENYESKVTLSLPSAEKQLETDVVFVLDKSTSTNVVEDAQKMLESLNAAVTNTGAKINIGVVIFNKEDHRVLELTELNGTTIDDIKSAVGNENQISGGTNAHAGLLAGKAMLDADTDVDASRKYLIFVSDGITYIFDDDEGTATSIVTEQYYYEASAVKSTSAMNLSGANMKYPTSTNFFTDSTVDGYLANIGELMKKDGEKYWVPYGSDLSEASKTLKSNVNEAGKETLPDDVFETYVGDDSVNDHANNVDTALYLTNQVYRKAEEEEGYHCYAVRKSSSASSDQPWADTFMDYLAGGETVSFEDIQNDILYLVDAGSYVEDYMGYVEGDYNFDFVNKAEALTMTVGGVELTTKKISENKYVFVESDNQGNYPYELTYYPANGDEANEHFVWTMNVPVTNLAHVKLTYTVKLMNPKTAAGTYGKYDSNGSARFDGLYTNNSAALYPKTTGSTADGAADWFLKPTVSYTVATPTPRPSTSKPSTSKPISSPKTFDAGIALYGAMALLSLTGGAWVVNKKRSDK